MSKCYSNVFKQHWNNTRTIFLCVILQPWDMLLLTGLTELHMFFLNRRTTFFTLSQWFFFGLHQNAFFRYNHFNRLLAVRVRVIIQFAKVFWSRKNWILHFFFYSSSIALLPLKQQVFEVGSLAGINIPYCLWKKNSMFTILPYTPSKDPIFGMHIQPTYYVNPT